MSCRALNERDCQKKYLSCEWTETESGESCRPIRSSVAMGLKKQEQREAKGGWIKIMLFLVIGLLVLFYAIQQAFGIETFDLFTGDASSKNTGSATYFIVFGAFAMVMGGIYYLLKKCDFSFSCFLLGGETGMMEQPVEEARYRKYTRDKLKRQFLEGGQTTSYDGNRKSSARVRTESEYEDEIADEIRQRALGEEINRY